MSTALPSSDQAAPVRVLKLGGSLLDLPDLRDRLLSWVKQQEPALNLMVVGGGKMIDAIRDLDRIHGFDPERIHWQCVEALGVTADLAAQLVNCPVLDSPAQLHAICRAGQPGLAVVQPRVFYTRDTMHGLPCSWQTTSDAIAALLAVETSASELVWLKSTSAATGTPQDWIREGLIDSAVACLLDRLPRTRLDNLRV